MPAQLVDHAAIVRNVARNIDQMTGWPHDADDLRAAASHIEALERGGWVSVGDRLPDHEDHEVLVWTTDECEIVATYDNGDWRDSVWGYPFPDTVRVTHWRPLPEPPSHE